LLGSFKILEDSMRIFESSLGNFLKDLAKIFAKILHDIQGFGHDLAKTSQVIFARILEDLR